MSLLDTFGIGGQPGSIWTPFTNPSVSWDVFKNGRTNILNKEIADSNLELQKQEQQWQHEFATDERDYNRALQQELFEREDTAIERQASQLSKLGINPLSQQMSGLNSGSPVGNVTPNSVTPQNNFQMQDTGILQALAPLASLANTINQVKTGEGQRDLIRSQVDKQQLDNFILAKENGIMPYDFKGFNYLNSQDISGNLFNRKNEEYFWNYMNKKNDYENKYKPQFALNMDYLLSDSFTQSAEKALTIGSKLFDKAFENTDIDTKKINPFQAFIKLFF